MVSKTRKAINPEDREKQLITLAVDQVEEQLKTKTAPAPVVLHYLKLGTEQAKLERELLKAKASQIETSSEANANYKMAIDAFHGYAPKGNKNDEVSE